MTSNNKETYLGFDLSTQKVNFFWFLKKSFPEIVVWSA